MKKIYTNIIAGIYKNRKILLPSISTTRASKKILRESFFNTLSYEIIDKTFIELFAGSGSMGIEAISRGAKESIFFEKNQDAFNTLNLNIQTLKIKNTQCILGDSFINAKNYIQKIKQNNEKAFFYFDPPFSCRQGNEDIYNKTIALIECISKENIHMICIEHMSTLELNDTIGCFTKIKEKKFGKSKLSYFN